MCVCIHHRGYVMKFVMLSIWLRLVCCLFCYVWYVVYFVTFVTVCCHMLLFCYVCYVVFFLCLFCCLILLRLLCCLILLRLLCCLFLLRFFRFLILLRFFRFLILYRFFLFFFLLILLRLFCCLILLFCYTSNCVYSPDNWHYYREYLKAAMHLIDSSSPKVVSEETVVSEEKVQDLSGYVVRHGLIVHFRYLYM